MRSLTNVELDSGVSFVIVLFSIIKSDSVPNTLNTLLTIGLNAVGRNVSILSVLDLSALLSILDFSTFKAM